jgi:hypothetical protein
MKTVNKKLLNQDKAYDFTTNARPCLSSEREPDDDKNCRFQESQTGLDTKTD